MSQNNIPKIIHQLWIGPKPAPSKLMQTWKEKNPDFEYILWNEAEFEKRNMNFECLKKINQIEEINGKADIMRWEILYKYGGVFIDADSICIEPIDDILMNKKSFAGWEQEKLRQGLIATGTMGFPINHDLPRQAINWILKNEVSFQKTQQMAWYNVGPGLLTRLYNTGKYKELHIFPSYTFLPIHLTGAEYTGHGKIYAYQEWGSTKQSYDTMNNVILPKQFLVPRPELSVSILIPSYNTKILFIKECLESIRDQVGYFNMEIVWINDGSNEINTQLLKKILEGFEKTTRFTKVVYHENETNKGLGYSLNLGVNLCSNEYIMRMDSDDVMVKNRIAKQFDYMLKNKNVMMSGTQIMIFKENIQNIIGKSNHQPITWQQFIKQPSHWFVNHPTYCFRKSAALAIGNYNPDIPRMIEDFDFSLRILKTYGYIHNMDECLLYYREHEAQVTNKNNNDPTYWRNMRNDLIKKMILS